MKTFKKTLSIFAIVAVMCAFPIISNASSGDVNLAAGQQKVVDSDYISAGSHQFNLLINSITFSKSATNKFITARVYGDGFTVYTNTYSGYAVSRRTYSLASADYVKLSFKNNSNGSCTVVDHSWTPA